MRLAAPCLLAAVAASACAGEAPAGPPPPTAIRALTLNVHGSEVVADPVRGPALAAEIDELRPDFAMLQECVDCALLLPHLPARYGLVAADDSPIAILYDQSAWSLTDSDVLVLGDNDDGWGRREARWAEFEPWQVDGTVRVYSTHWCVTIRTPDDACDVARQLGYGAAITDDIARRGAASIVGGDLNVFDGFEDGEVVEALRARGLVDTLREVTAEPVITFEGNDWAPAGRIDYVFATAPVDVTEAAVAATSVSDHRAVTATVLLRR
jgi:endonuclease/exonuclease/phosphatase family metal-dependent hydrolase